MVLPPLNFVRLNGHLQEPPRREHSRVPANWPLQRLSLHVAGTLSPPRDGPSESSTVWSFVRKSSSAQPCAVSSPVRYSNSYCNNSSSSSSSNSSSSSSSTHKCVLVPASGSWSTTGSSTSTTGSHRSALLRPHHQSASTPLNPQPSLVYTRLEQATTHTQLLAALQALPDMRFGSALGTDLI